MKITIETDDYGHSYFLCNKGRRLEPAYPNYDDAYAAKDLLLDLAGNLRDDFDLPEKPELEKGA
jgi:hypothetical protein